MHDILLGHQRLGCPRVTCSTTRATRRRRRALRDDLRLRQYAARVARTSRPRMEGGIAGTPTFFINGRRHYGVYDIGTLTEEVRAAKNRARLAAPPAPDMLSNDDRAA